ncbi:MAG: methyltransferase domain-containing protein [Verrucomicrobiota bacterium]|nr:methyltransferase domain-containing protein [Verrucomicrobiota bacterium]
MNKLIHPTSSLLNLACGQTRHDGWLNGDQFEQDGVFACDLRQPLPFDDHSFDVLYSSHFLEHLGDPEARSFLRECMRVLKPGGILRLVVPNLEDIARDYLGIIDGLENESDLKTEHQWILLELFDQMTREKPQGTMGPFLSEREKRESKFIRKRIGGAIEFFDSRSGCNTDQTVAPSSSIFSLLKKLLKESDFRTDRFIKLFFPKHHKSYLLHPSGSIFVEICHLLTPGISYREIKSSKFRNSGEVHFQAFDRFSLKWLLEDIGFVKIEKMKADLSQIKNCKEFFLDCGPDGSIRKADSLYVEAMKPDSN